MKPLTYEELEGMRAELIALNEELHSHNIELHRALTLAFSVMKTARDHADENLICLWDDDQPSQRDEWLKNFQFCKRVLKTRKTRGPEHYKKLRKALHTLINASDALTSAIETATDQFDAEKGDLMDATSAAEKALRGGAA